MQYLNLNNSVNNRKESEKRINYISTRIKNLENDIYKIKNKEKVSFFNPNKTYIANKQNLKIISEYKSKPKNIYARNVNQYTNKKLLNSYNADDSICKNISNKFNLKKFIINQKQKDLLNNSLQMNKNIKKIKYISKNKNIFNIRASNNNNLNKMKQFFTFSKSMIKEDEINNNNMLKHYNNKYMENLEYKFELRLLKKKINSLTKENKEINEKLENIKNINETIAQNIIQNEKEVNILNDLISLNKQLIADNSLINAEYELNNDKFSLENIILNIMDLKYNYDNHLLINEFIYGVNNILNLSLLNPNNEIINQNNLLVKIIQLIDLKNNLYKSINKYDCLLKDNKYYNYFTSLLNNLNLKNIYELDTFIKTIYIENIKEDSHMKKIKDTLIKESILSKPKNELKNHYYSSKRLINSDRNCKLHNFLINKKNDSRIIQNKIDLYLNQRKKFSKYINKKSLNKTEQIRNIDNRLNLLYKGSNNNTSYQNKNKFSLNFSEKHLSDKNKKIKTKKKININLYSQRNNNCYKIKKNFNTNENQNNLFNTEDGMNDIKLIEINEDNKINNRIYSYKNFYGNEKNNSLIIVNK